MSRADYLDLGTWNAVCYQCGFKFKASELRRHWQGYYVCARCFEVRQPQDFVRAVPEVQTPPWVQPRPTEIFAAVCYPNDISAIPDYATPNCAKPDYIHPLNTIF